MKNLRDICPRNCKIDRINKMGYCSSTNKIKIAKVMRHFWEEPIISGENGSGAIFFSNCNLKCIFCQNYEISSKGFGKEYEISDLVNIFKDLEKKKVSNINLVSPTQYTSQIIEALKIYKPNIPIVWNSNGYEKPETLSMLKDYVDIYLCDLKYYDEKLSLEFSGARDYFKYASKSIIQMRKNQPSDIIENEIMKKGLIIRHLVMPNCVQDSFNVLDWIASHLGNKTYISIMNQYIPYYKAIDNKLIGRKIRPLEYKAVKSHALNLGFENGFFQEKESADTCYIPKFDGNINID